MTNNEIGDLGEAIFNVEITRDYIFRPRHLGEKWPSSDFYVELIGPKEHFFFIVQVRYTTQGNDASGNMKIQAPKKKIADLKAYYSPTYLAGVSVKWCAIRGLSHRSLILQEEASLRNSLCNMSQPLVVTLKKQCYFEKKIETQPKTLNIKDIKNKLYENINAFKYY